MLIRSRLTFLCGTSIVLFYTSLCMLVACSRPSHLELKAQSEIERINLAILVYAAKYGHLPVVTNSVKNTDNSCQEVALFTCPEAGEPKLIDTQLYYYFDVYSHKVKDGKILDPWGCPYHLMLDTKNIGKLRVGNQDISRSVVIWSNGRNKRNEYGAGDDVCSWKDMKD